MLAARLGAWLRKTGERWAKAAFSEKLAVALALAAVIYTVVTGAAELRYQARAREALAQVKTDLAKQREKLPALQLKVLRHRPPLCRPDQP